MTYETFIGLVVVIRSKSTRHTDSSDVRGLLLLLNVPPSIRRLLLPAGKVL